MVGAGSHKVATAAELLKKVEEKKKATEVKVKTKELDVILIDYREQLTRFDLYAADFDYILMIPKSHEKAEEIVRYLDEFKPVRVKVKVKVDIVPAGPDMEMVEDITGDIVEVVEIEPITDVLNAPIYHGVGTVGFSRSGAVRIRSDGEVLVVNTATRNGERLKVLANREAEILYGVAKVVERASGYRVAEGIYFIPVEKAKQMLEEAQQ